MLKSMNSKVKETKKILNTVRKNISFENCKKKASNYVMNQRLKKSQPKRKERRHVKVE